MFNIGQTSGVGQSSAPPGNPVESVKDYLTKMAKTASELPSAVLAKTKVVIVSKGEMGGPSTEESALDSTSPSAGGDGEGADEGAEATQRAGGTCGRNRQANKNGIQKKSDCAKSCSKSANPDNTTPTIDPEVEVPSEMDEVLESSLPSMEEARKMSASEFKRSFCDKEPYPECEYCKLANSLGDIDEGDLLSILGSLKFSLDELTKGNVALADNLFNCPGQLSALAKEKLGPLGTVVGPCAAAAVIGMTAVSGAVSSFSAVVNVYAHTDFLGELRDSVGRLIGSGGVTRSFTKMANDTIAKLGLTTRNLYLCSPSHNTSAYVAGGNTRLLGVLFGDTKSHELAAIRANLFDKQLERLWEQAEAAITFPSATRSAANYSYKGGVVATKDTTARAGVTYSYKNADGGYTKLIDKNGESEFTPGQSLVDATARYGQLYETEGSEEKSGTTTKMAYDPVTSFTPGKTYSFYDVETDTYTELEVSSEEEFKELTDKYGTLYTSDVIRPSGAPYQTTTDIVPSVDKEYFKKVGDSVVKAETEDLFITGDNYVPVDTFVSGKTYVFMVPGKTEYVTCTDTTVVVGKVYYERKGSGTREDPYVYAVVTDPSVEHLHEYYEFRRTPPTYTTIGNVASQEQLDELIKEHGTIYVVENDVIVDGKCIEELPFDVLEQYSPGSDKLPENSPLILPDGSLFTKPVPMDGSILTEAVATPNLVTKNHISAADMSQLYGIGLTVDELKMAYILDHEANGSIMPRDVKAEVIPTVLDTIVDDW